MLSHYLITAWTVFMRRKLFTAINLLCIVLTLTVLLYVTTLLDYTFYPSGTEHRSNTFLQIDAMEWTQTKGDNRRISGLGYKTIATYIKTLKTPQLVATAGYPQSVAAYHEGNVYPLTLRRADAEYWQILDFQVLAGRVPTQDDVQQGRFVLTLSESAARRVFGSTAVVGRKLTLGLNTFEVIGVVADTSHVNSWADAWAPITTYPSSAYRDQQSGGFAALLLARSPADFPAIQQEVEQAAKSYQFDEPEQFQIARFWADTKLDLVARSLLDNIGQRESGALRLLSWIAFSMMAFMLLPALNLVNMNAGRIAERATEIGVRKAFGATNAQLLLQFVVENVLLCLAGSVLAYLCAYGALALVVQAALIPTVNLVPAPNLSVFGAALVLATIFGVVSGVLPAWKMARLDPVHALKGGV